MEHRQQRCGPDYQRGELRREGSTAADLCAVRTVRPTGLRGRSSSARRYRHGMLAEVMDVRELAWACRLYRQLTTYDSSLRDFRLALGGELDP